MLRRITPALALLVIAPLVAEFLLGDFNIRQIGFLLVFIPVYGTGALLVRELARRTGRGWPTMLAWALAYALILEGFTNQTLFNPDYAGQHLLAYGFVPSLGTSFNFAIFVLTLHVVWSVGSAVALAEALAGDRWRTPWLRMPGLAVIAVLTLLGLGATVSFTLRTFPFMASPGQFAATGVLVLVAIGAGLLPRRDRPADAGVARHEESADRSGAAPSFLAVLLTALVLSSAFQRWFGFAPRHGVPAGLGLAGLLGLEVVAIALFRGWSRRAGWGPRQVLAAASGAMVTDGWISLRRLVVAGGTSLGVPTTPIDVVGQAGLLLALLALSYLGCRRLTLALSRRHE